MSDDTRAVVERAVADAHRREWAFVLAATARVADDLDLAEGCLQDAYLAALEAWARDGVPRKPRAWLTTTAKRKALDALRRDQVFRAKCRCSQNRTRSTWTSPTPRRSPMTGCA